MTTRAPITRIQGDTMAVNSYIVEDPKVSWSSTGS
jgi:hypothetical protein